MEKFTDWLNESKEEDKVQKYKKKPVTVEAIKWTGDNFEDVKSFAGKNVKIDHNAMTMKDWVEKLNAFLQFNSKEILHNAGKISSKVAQELAYKEYDKFKIKQDKLYKSDFDYFLNETRMIENGSGNNG